MSKKPLSAPPLVQKLLLQLQQRFEPLAQREKLIIVLVAIALVVMLFQLIAIDPLLKRRDVLQKEQQQLERDTNLQHVEREALTLAIAAGPKLQKQQQLDGLRQEVTMLDEQIARTTATMIPPRKMTDVLHDVMQLRKSLKLVQMENLQPTPLLEDGATEKNPSAEQAANGNVVAENSGEAGAASGDVGKPVQDAAASNDIGLYRHGVKLVFEGDYMTTMEFLESLEKKSWRFFWQGLQYDVERYPKARVTLTLYTLSPERAWLGV